MEPGESAGLIVSIHAPVRGATGLLHRFERKHWWFQSTRPYGARPDVEKLMTDLVVFQSTRPYGARLRPRARLPI